ncbi:MAG: carboxypeptidase regulatory-like domain-containing protein, partial [Terriglobales bacterium]
MPQSIGFKRVVYVATALAAAFFFACWAPAGAIAQSSSSGTITGQVTDAQGKAIGGAVISLTNSATNGAQATISNDSGRYVFVNLQPGTYTVDVKKEGFKEALLKNQDVAVGKQLNLNVPMQVGASTQTVEVSATGAELQTLNATVGETLGSDAILKLPALSRDANSLTNLQPNTSTDGGVGGADRDQNSFTLDGGNNSDDMDGSHASYTGTQGGSTSGTIPVPAESIQQFSIGVINQTADVNSAAGSSVAMVTKRGTDTVHGSAYEYYLGSYLSANSWGNDQSIPFVPKGKSHQNRFGAALGGQILPNWLGGKTYLFGNFEGRRFPNSAVFSRPVPTPLLRAGVIQAQDAKGNWQPFNLNPTAVTVNGVTYQPTAAPVAGQPGGACAPYLDTATTGQLAGTTTTSCDPRGLGPSPTITTTPLNAGNVSLWSKYMPLPNSLNGGDGFNTLNYTSNLDESLRSNFFVARMDHDFLINYHFTG